MQRSVVLLYSMCLWSTYREVDIGNWWSSCHKNLDNLCMSCPCCQVKWAGTLVVGAITRGFVAKQQLHDVSGIQKKKEWLKKELLDPNFFSSLWNSNTNASCIFFLLMDSEVGRGVARVYWKCAGGTNRERGKNPTVALQLSSLSLLSYWVWKDAWTCPAQDIFCPRNTFCNWSIFSLWNWYCQKKRVHTCLCMSSWTPSKFKFKYGMLAGISEGAHLISKLC